MTPAVHQPPASPARSTQPSVRALPFQGDQTQLVAALRKGHPGAAAALHDRYARRIYGLLYRILGPDTELEDTLHEVFVRALESLGQLRDPAAFDSWLMGVAVRTARTLLQRRGRRSWLRLVPEEELPEVPVAPEDPAHVETLRVTYRILDTLPVDDRMALVLRFAAGMTLTETADACAVSLATIKRRLSRAQRGFQHLAANEPVLHAWREEVGS